MSSQEELLYYINNPSEAPWQKIKGRNSMGCSELWYNPFYCITQTFTKEELANMSGRHVDDLIKLADRICEAFY